MSYFENKYSTYNKWNRKMATLYEVLYYGRNKYNMMLNVYFQARKEIKILNSNPHLKHNETYNQALQRWRILSNLFVPINDPRINIIRASHRQNALSRSFGKKLIKSLLMKLRLNHYQSSKLLESSNISEPKIYLYKPLIALHYGFLEKIRWVKGVINDKTAEFHEVKNGKVYVYNYYGTNGKWRKLIYKEELNKFLHSHNDFRILYTKGKYWAIIDSRGRLILDVLHKGVRKVKNYLNKLHSKNLSKHPTEFYEMSNEFKPSSKAETFDDNLVNVHSQGLLGSIKHLNGNDRKHLNKVIKTVFCKATGYDKHDVYVNTPEFQMRDKSANAKAGMYFSYLDDIYTQKVLPVPVRHRAKKKIRYVARYDQYLHKMHVLPQVSKHTPKQDYVLFKNWKYNKAFVLASENSVHDKVMRVAIQPKRQINVMNKRLNKHFKSAMNHFWNTYKIMEKNKSEKRINIAKKYYQICSTDELVKKYRHAMLSVNPSAWSDIPSEFDWTILNLSEYHMSLSDEDCDKANSFKDWTAKMLYLAESCDNYEKAKDAEFICELVAHRRLHYSSIVLSNLTKVPSPVTYRIIKKEAIERDSDTSYSYSTNQLQLYLCKPT